MIKIAVIGLGYVGLPLAIAFSKFYKVIGYDVNKLRILQLKKNIDSTGEITSKQLSKKNKLFFSNDINDIINANTFIIAVPTPLKKNNKPDLKLLKSACILVSKFIKKNDVVIFESTVYPGLTEEICVPILNKNSKLKFNKDFFCGYSPERINPGDKKNNLENIKKITSGSNKKTANFVDKLYKKIIKAGTHKVSSIKIAEAAKVIENAQRDINIAFINDITKLFDKLNIDIYETLKAASTKWNFLNFKPGLVGGHCVAIDPYYLYYKGLSVGYQSNLILSSRKINESMPDYVVKKIKQNIKKRSIKKRKINILLLGITFKENCNDTRNSLVIDVYKKLSKNYLVEVYDPLVNSNFFLKNKIKYLKKIIKFSYDVVILAVPHNYFINLGTKKLRKYMAKNSFIFDLKGVLSKENDIEYI